MPDSKLIEAYQQFGSVSTDTRKINKNDIFIALSGENFDGNKFAEQALEKGASYVVIDDAAHKKEGDDRYILVDDCLKTLQALANWYRKQFDVPFIAITGTNGKTTTKELVYAVLSTEKKVHATSGNLNNHIGVPLTLLSMPADTEIAVIEMGANKPGDIAELCEIAEPTHGLITNIGRAHLELFLDLEGVKRTKGEMFDYLSASGGIAFVNLKDENIRDYQNIPANRIDFGVNGSSYFIKTVVEEPEFTEIFIHFSASGDDHLFNTSLIGQHNADNVLAAVVVGTTMGINMNSIHKGIRQYVPRMNRTQLIRNGAQLILMDAYNANPSSMEATIKSVAANQAKYRKIALILGDMFELGENSTELHSEVIRFAREILPGCLIIGVGKDMGAAVVAYQDEQMSGFSAMEECLPQVKELLNGCDFVLIKGSRGMKMERILPSIGLDPTGF